MKRPFTLAAVALFSIVALVQLLRLLMGWEVTIEGFAAPLWASGVAVVVAAGLAVTVWRNAFNSARPVGPPKRRPAPGIQGENRTRRPRPTTHARSCSGFARGETESAGACVRTATGIARAIAQRTCLLAVSFSS